MELATSNVTDIYCILDAKIHDNLKLVDIYYVEDKPSQEDWYDMMDEYEYFCEEFQ